MNILPQNSVSLPTFEAESPAYHMTPPACPTCENHNCFIRNYAGKDWRTKLNNERLTLNIKKGEVLFREGDPVSGIFFIYHGKIKVYNSGIQNRTQIVRFAGVGNIVGHRGFGTVTTYPIGATALENSIVCFFPMQLFFDALQDNPPLTLGLLNFYADELRRAERKLRSLSQMTVKQKLAEAILTLSEIYGIKNAGAVEFLNVQLSRQEYADIIGSSIEEAIRTISLLKKENLIVTEGKKIGIANRQSMEEMLKGFGPLRLP